ncbi:hypothetical protein [Bathymodiolus platifrons methanotrophic gill symbiont]|nr:hypothetical protein [Bathymodiolus platifrons methanotrophic gill symbiont]
MLRSQRRVYDGSGTYAGRLWLRRHKRKRLFFPPRQATSFALKA